MNTIESIKKHGEELMQRLMTGIALSNDQMKVVEIYLSLYGKKAGNAGKRKVTKTGK